MDKEFIPYEQALALKELGFDKPCFASFGKKGEFKYKVHLALDLEMVEEVTENFNRYVGTYYQVSAPTFSQAFRWFREKYDITQTIARDGSLAKEGRWAYTIIADLIYFNDGYFTPEEAELACLKKLIEIVNVK